MFWLCFFSVWKCISKRWLLRVMKQNTRVRWCPYFRIDWACRFRSWWHYSSTRSGSFVFMIWPNKERFLVGCTLYPSLYFVVLFLILQCVPQVFIFMCCHCCFFRCPVPCDGSSPIPGLILNRLCGVCGGQSDPETRVYQSALVSRIFPPVLSAYSCIC